MMPKAVFTLTPEEIDEILLEHISDKFNLRDGRNLSFSQRREYEITMNWDESRFLTVTAQPVTISPMKTPNWGVED